MSLGGLRVEGRFLCGLSNWTSCWLCSAASWGHQLVFAIAFGQAGLLALLPDRVLPLAGLSWAGLRLGLCGGSCSSAVSGCDH